MHQIRGLFFAFLAGAVALPLFLANVTAWWLGANLFWLWWAAFQFQQPISVVSVPFIETTDSAGRPISLLAVFFSLAMFGGILGICCWTIFRFVRRFR